MVEGTTVLPINKDPGTSGSPKRAGFVLGRRSSLVVSAGVVGHTLWTSAAPTLTYRLYAEEWHLAHTATTAIFAVYPIAVVATLVGFGGISDQIGRRSAMLLGLGASLAGALLFAVAPDVWWVFAGRAFMGVGVGLSAGPSTAAILEFCSHQDAKRAASLTMTAQAAGFAAGLLVGGALTEYGPWPTRLCFWVLAVLLLVLLAATWFLPRQTIAGENGGWRPKMPFVPKDLRRAFATASTAMMAAYAFGVLVLSLGGQVEHDLIGSSNALLNAAVLALFPIVLAPVGIVAKVLSSRIALSIGSITSACSPWRSADTICSYISWRRRPPEQGTACCSSAVCDSSTRQDRRIIAAVCFRLSISRVIFRWEPSPSCWVSLPRLGGSGSPSIWAPRPSPS